MLDEAVIDRNDASSFVYVGKDSKGKSIINIRLLDAYLSYYMRIEKPEKLSDRKWAEQIQNLHYIRHQEKLASEQR